VAFVIGFEGIGKRYLIRHDENKARYRTFRDQIGAVTRRFAKVIAGKANGSRREEFWALRDISLDIARGDRLGIIGRNGAGKSTLLKLLSRITEPTIGTIRIRGRVASLLEVGTGFHPELTGRENVFLNGSILGMTRGDIKRKFDEIVAFAEVEQFVDTPVKRYSSGMQVRLAFAVAAHLEPEILLVDEVLAVGDLQFQKKSLGKMESVSSEEGRTVLFVSHNMAAISSLCTRCVYLSKGRLEYLGSTSDAILSYHNATGGSSPSHVVYENYEQGDDSVEMLSGRIETNEVSLQDLTIHDQVTIRVQYRVRKQVDAAVVPNFRLSKADGAVVFVANAPQMAQRTDAGLYEAECRIPGDLLNDGAYFVGLALTSYTRNGLKVNCWDQNALLFNMRDPMDERSNRYGYGGSMPGAVRPKLQWTVQKVDR
jgi:lipopolysaccharide transport system ATP-binding protein